MRNKNGVILYRMNAHVYNIIIYICEVTRENMAGHVYVYNIHVRVYGERKEKWSYERSAVERMEKKFFYA